jgi:hypothetical protein
VRADGRKYGACRPLCAFPPSLLSLVFAHGSLPVADGGCKPRGLKVAYRGLGRCQLDGMDANFHYLVTSS